MNNSSAANQVQDGFVHALDLYYRCVQSLVGIQVLVEQFDFWQGLTAKILTHSLSMLYLTNGTRLALPSVEVNMGDSSSVLVLARAIAESYATLYYLFFDANANEDEREFRFAYEQMRGLLVRQRVISPDHIDQRSQDRLLIAQLLVRVQNTQAFRRVRARRNGSDAARQIAHGRYQHITRTEMLVRAGFIRPQAEFMYAFLSDAVHGGYFNAMQVGQQISREAQRQAMGIAFTIGAVTLGLAISNLIEAFQAVRDLVNSSPEDQALIRVLRGIAQDDSIYA